MIGRPTRASLPGATQPTRATSWQASRAASVKHALVRTFPGRALVLGVTLRVLSAVAGAAGLGSAMAVQLVERVGSIALIIGGGYFAYRLIGLARRRLLWRVRRKLILSYVFMGVVPALLIVAFFVLCGLLLFFHVSSYLVQNQLQGLADEARAQARATAYELQHVAALDERRRVLDRRQQSLTAQFPGASLAVVTARLTGCAGSGPSDRGNKLPAMSAGPWAHLAAPTELPEWVPCNGFGGVLAYIPAGAGNASAGRPRTEPNVLGQTTRLAVRGVAIPDGPSPVFAIVVDIPLNDAIASRVRDETGIRLGRASVVLTGRDDVRPAEGRPERSPSAVVPSRTSDLFSWVTLIEYTDWRSGHTAPVTWAIDLNISRIYDRLSSTQARIGNRSFGQILLLLLAVVAVLFLVIEFFALIMGFALAKSITGSVHELFVGTDMVRGGEFGHRIKVEARDQLGELADSFNSMTASIEGLLLQKAEKDRLEEELKVARRIQLSLLPQGKFEMPGISITAICEPAREVGGDYYDLFPLGDQSLGVVIADVSGKGASAALYMAQLKGLMLSLSQNHHSPRELLIRANRIIADNLDTKSFITMTYAVIDLQAATMTYARAGHTPLIYLQAGESRRACVLAPDGLVVGLKLDRGERFEQLLEEVRLPLTPGDLFVFFTDGISEAMNPASDCFDEARLSSIVEEHGHLPTDELRERIVREIDTFAAGEPQHDDRTLILVRIEALGAHLELNGLAVEQVGL